VTKQYGYADKILKVDLSSGKVSHLLTENYSDPFLGGRGITAKIYWDEVPHKIDAADPENRLIFMTGPVCGVPGFAADSRSAGRLLPLISSLTATWAVLGALSLKLPATTEL
jgi:aldehyde:ferredoxin oxidoreductase